VSLLVDWLSRPRAGKGLRLLNDSGDWGPLIDYAAIADSAARFAGAIRQSARGSGPVAIVLPNGPDFVAAFFASVIAGRGACPLAPHLAFDDRDRYIEHVARVLSVARPSLVLTDGDSSELMREAVVASKESMPILDSAEAAAHRPDTRETVSRIGLVQFTSGSSGRPRGALVSVDNLAANLRMNTAWLGIRPDDTFASWLPMFHDMGLIGSLSMIVNQIDVLIMRPQQFIVTPVRWLECFGRRGATLGVSPAFGFAYADKRIDEEDLAGNDFTGWRTVVIGSDPINPQVLARFAARLRDHGFSPSTFVPAYGLAEATLSVSGRWNDRRFTAPDVGPEAVEVNWERARFGKPVPIARRATVGRELDFGDGAGWVTNCGVPHRELSLTIVDGGRVLPDGCLGEIVLRGPSVAEGYRGEGGNSSTTLEDGVLSTGDAGFLLDGCLYVVGRLGDSFKLRGRPVFAEDLDLRLGAAPRVPRGRCVALAGILDGQTTVVGLVEREPGPWMEPASKSMARGLPHDVVVMVASVPPGTIQRTSSGKPRRQMMWTALAQGTLRVNDFWQLTRERRQVEV
jgi:acyl-CoA synthetase (AMP-forming)/AMP-acid ligase II